MSISDEIRNDFVRGDGVDAVSYRKLLSIADRIDSEMIELPKSADGRIWTGREVCFWTRAGYHNFGCVSLRDDKWYVEDVYGMNYNAESVWYERPDSWETIADELEEWCDSVDVVGDACEKPRDLANRIRKLAAKED